MDGGLALRMGPALPVLSGTCSAGTSSASGESGTASGLCVCLLGHAPANLPNPEHRRRFAAAEADSDDDGEWEEAGSSGDEGGEGQEERGSLSGVVAKRLFGLEDALALGEDDVDDTVLTNVDAAEAERRKSDPISQIDLPAVLRDVFRSLAVQQPAVLQAAWCELGQEQTKEMQALLQ